MVQENNKLPTEASEKLELIKNEFLYSSNNELNIRNIYIKALNNNGILVFMNGMVDSIIIENHIIQPLVTQSFSKHSSDLLKMLETQILTVKTIEYLSNISDVVANILNGNTILLIDRTSYVLSLNTVGFEHRNIEKPTNENVIKGPKEAFVESAQTNLSLIKRQLKNNKLVIKKVSIGTTGLSNIYIVYIDGIAKADIVNKVEKKISALKTEYIPNLSILEQKIEHRSYSFIPSVMYTERPDRVSNLLCQGHVGLIMDNSPSCLIVPITFWTLFNSVEDVYERWAYGNFVRIVRLIAFFIALITPALYIAVTNYHQQMIPSDLILSIAGTRETLPFPAIVEVLLMEVAFELIREAGTRIPTTIGPTIGIVGALILGQAAVEANIISPILVIVVSITGLASFAIQEISLNYMIRINRFILIISSYILGFYGFAVYLTLLCSYLTRTKSFGIPFLSPIKIENSIAVNDGIIRPSLWKHCVNQVKYFFSKNKQCEREE